MSTLVLTSLAMLAFAANSLLCRLALGNASIDAATFTTVRLLSGAVVLLLSKAITLRLLVASAAPLSGAAIVLVQRNPA